MNIAYLEPRRTQQRDQDLGRALEAIRRRNRARLGLTGLGALPGPASALSSALRRVTVRSTLLPPGGVTWAPGSSEPTAGGGWFGEWLARTMRLDVEVGTALGNLRYAPQGQSDGEYFPLLALGAGVTGAGVLYLLWRGVRAIIEGRRGAR